MRTIHQSCPKLYECSRIRMTPMIRALLRCTASEAMESLCANCYEKPAELGVPLKREAVPAGK